MTRCEVKTEEIGAAWKRLGAWVEAGPHAPARHQRLAEHVVFVGVPPEEMVLDLYMPIRT